jgi:hypothetical protein
MKLVLPSLARSSCFFVLLVYIVMFVLVFYLCPSPVRVVTICVGTVLFHLLCSVPPVSRAPLVECWPSIKVNM